MIGISLMAAGVAAQQPIADYECQTLNHEGVSANFIAVIDSQVQPLIIISDRFSRGQPYFSSKKDPNLVFVDQVWATNRMIIVSGDGQSFRIRFQDVSGDRSVLTAWIEREVSRNSMTSFVQEAGFCKRTGLSAHQEPEKIEKIKTDATLRFMRFEGPDGKNMEWAARFRCHYMDLQANFSERSYFLEMSSDRLSYAARSPAKLRVGSDGKVEDSFLTIEGNFGQYFRDYFKNSIRTTSSFSAVFGDGNAMNTGGLQYFFYFNDDGLRRNGSVVVRSNSKEGDLSPVVGVGVCSVDLDGMEGGVK